MTRQKLVQQHAKCVNVAARINIVAGHLGLFRAHVRRCSDELVERREQRLARQRLLGCLGNAKINHLGNGHPIMQRD